MVRVLEISVYIYKIDGKIRTWMHNIVYINVLCEYFPIKKIQLFFKEIVLNLEKDFAKVERDVSADLFNSKVFLQQFLVYILVTFQK